MFSYSQPNTVKPRYSDWARYLYSVFLNVYNQHAFILLFIFVSKKGWYINTKQSRYPSRDPNEVLRLIIDNGDEESRDDNNRNVRNERNTLKSNGQYIGMNKPQEENHEMFYTLFKKSI